jgi:hypothetical protein
MSNQKVLQVVTSRFNSSSGKKMKKIPTIFVVLVPAILSLLLVYFSMKNFNNNNAVIMKDTSTMATTTMTTTSTSTSSLINNASNNNNNNNSTIDTNNSSKSQSQSQSQSQLQSQSQQQIQTGSSTTTTITIDIPSCDQSPWKLLENLIGSCPGGLKPHKSKSKSIQECAIECCNSDKCITWQYREDVGCLHGGDVRLGMEKDGPSSWCSDIQPKRWQGQYVLKRANGEIFKNKEETGACSIETWNPYEQPGQCFGLGDVKMTIDEKNNGIPISSAKDCMMACCNSKKLNGECGAWQYHDDLGCYYHKRMHGCVNTTNPIVFEPFIGRRKQLSTRKYTDKHGNPWTQQQQQQQQ